MGGAPPPRASFDVDEVESGARIPIAKDSSGNLIHIHDARRKRWYYRCVECEGFLHPKLGERREWHFAHYQGEGEGCSLRSAQGVDRLIERLKRHTRDRALRTKVARLGIRLHPYKPVATSLALLPTLTMDELRKLFDLGGSLESLTVHGALRDPPAEAFRPSESWVAVEMPPFTTERLLEVRSNVPFESRLLGKWRSRQVREGQLFAIQGKTGVESANDAFEIGDEVITVQPLQDLGIVIPSYWIDSTPIYRFVLDERARSRLIGSQSTSRRLRVRVILPAHAEPRGSEAIRPVDEEGTLILVQIPAGEELETVMSPHDDRVKIGPIPTPEGTQEIRIPADRDSVLQLSIHFRIDSHHIEILPLAPKQKFTEIDPVVFECRLDTEVTEVTPWGRDSEVSLNPGPKEVPSLDSWGLTGIRMPEGIKIEKINARYSGPHMALVRPGFTDATELEALLLQMLKHGPIEEISIDFGALGEVSFKWNLPVWRVIVFTEEEILSKLRALESDIPNKIRWVFVLELLGLGTGFPHHLLAGGTRKKIRLLAKQVQKEGGGSVDLGPG